MFQLLWFFPIISSLLLSAGFEHRFLSYLSLVGIVPLLVFVWRTNSKKRAFWGGWLAGFIFFALTSRWLLYTFSLNWANLQSGASAVSATIFVWLLLSFTLGTSFGIFALLAFKLKTGTVLDSIIMPSIWIFAEYLKAWIFMLTFWGPGGTLAPYWTMGNLGYVLVDTKFIFWSRLAGVYGVSFIIVFVNAAIFLLLNNAGTAIKKIKAVAVLSIIILSLIILPNWLFSVQPEKKLLQVALLQTDSPFGFAPSKALIALWKTLKSGEINLVQPDLVIFPEDSQSMAFMNADDKILLRHLFPDENRPGLIITSVNETGFSVDAPKEMTIYRNQKGELIDSQEKTFLIPAGEFLPIAVKMFVNIGGNPEIAERFTETRVLTPGNKPEYPVSFGATKIGTLLCSGILSSSLYRSLAKGGAEILINPASLIIFNHNPLLFSQIKNMARFQAIANGRPFIQSANGGQAFYINENGKIVAETKSSEAQFILANVAPVKTKTVFSKFGDWPLAITVILLLALSLIIRSHKGRLWGHKLPLWGSKNQGILAP